MSVIAGLCLCGNREIHIEDHALLIRQLQRYPANRTGEWHKESVLLICRQQWITSESRSEMLPIYDRQRGLAITADAILDNREDLFAKLVIPAADRSGMTDSELILLAYEKWGFDAPRHVVGDFAFVIWDERKRHLFGARDPLGNRTLYFTSDGTRFAFCTAIQPLLALPGVDRKLDEAWLSEYLAIPTMLDAADPFETVHAAIRQLPPAHSFVFSANGRTEFIRYGTLVPAEQLRFPNDNACIEAFRDVFDQAVRAKIRTYREVAASLSGGLDSGAVVSYAAKALVNKGKMLHTYSYVPPQDFADWTPSGLVANERPFIEETVRHVGNLNEHYLAMADRDPFSEIDELLDIREMPYKMFENSFWIKELYVRAEQQNAGVLLTGAQGNHTISWGTALEYYTSLLKRLRWMKLYRELKQYSRRMRVGRAKLLPLIGKEAFTSLLPDALARFEPPFPSMIHPDYAEKTGVYSRLRHREVGLAPSRIDASQEREHHFNNPVILNLIGTSGAKFSLRYGLWERDPTADHRVIRFCLALPLEQYIRNGVDRALVRRATQGDLPDNIRLNQRYRGVQGADWVHRMRSLWPAFLTELQAMCTDSLANGLLNIPQVKESLARIGDSPRPELALDSDARFLMRCVIVYRFLKRSA